MNKKLWKSKTFWLNILSGAAAISGVIPLAPEHVAIATAVINIGLRLPLHDTAQRLEKVLECALKFTRVSR